MPMDMERHGWLARLFEAKQQWSTMSPKNLTREAAKPTCGSTANCHA